MITAPANWLTAMSKRVRRPLFLVEIEGYPRALSNRNYAPAHQPGPTGFVMDPPVALVGTQRIKWSWPSTASVGTQDAHGFSTASPLGSGEITMLRSGPFAPTYTCNWGGFNAVTLPFDAVVVGIYPVIAYFRTDNGEPHTCATFHYWDGGEFGGVEYLNGEFEAAQDVIGSIADIPGGTITAELQQSLGPNDTNTVMEIHQVGVAVIYTSASEDAGGTSGGGSWPYPWLKMPDDLQLTVEEQDGSATLGQQVFTVEDLEALVRPITADMADFTFEGKRITLKMGTKDLDYPDLHTLFTGYIDNVDNTDQNSGYQFTCSDVVAKLDTVIWTEGDDGQPTDNDHPRTINGNPMEIALAVLREVGLLESEIDAATMEAHRDSTFAGVNFSFSITSPPNARDFLKKEIMVPLGGIIWPTNLGVVTVRFMAPLDGNTDPVVSLTKRDIDGIPVAAQATMVNTISYRFDKDDSSSGSGKFLSEAIEVYQKSLDKYNDLPGQIVIESSGVRSSFQGFWLAAFVAQMYFLRVGLKNLTFQLDGQWLLVLLEPFDLLQVSHPQIPDRLNGVMGITDWLVQAMDKTIGYSAGRISLRVLDANAMSAYGRFKIAPDSVPDWTLATGDQKARYLFISDAAGLMSDATPAPTMG